MKQNLPANQSTMIIAGATCAVIFICLIIAAVIFFKLNPGGNNNNNGITPTPAIIEEDVKTAKGDYLIITKAFVSGFTGYTNNYSSFYYFDPNITLGYTEAAKALKIAKLEVTRVALTNKPAEATLKTLAPQHINPVGTNIDPYFNEPMGKLNYNFDSLADSSSGFAYNIITGKAKFFDDYSSDSGIFRFRVLVYNAGSFLLNADTSPNANYALKLAGLMPAQIDAELKFRVKVTFSNNEITFKDFSRTVNGTTFIDNGGFTDMTEMTLNQDGQQF